ncbi:Outer dynein arm protein 1 [Phytophthora citrophthora]|uniref:Outer dynein arm protein 1 n=1 Tax=Phytophthora citrophthora TaxID=4793 RepID=A0AAD9LM70_9STRA|nr:Outer dynein arm protein 1 [Phytophthora citrophthora]
MSGDLRPETDSDGVNVNADAVSRLLGTNTTLGIIAGLTLAAANEHHGDEGDNNDPPLFGSETTGRARRRSVLGLLGAGSNGFAASSPAKKLPGVHSTALSVLAPRETIQRLQNHNKLLKQELSIEARAARELLGQDKRSRVEQLRSTLATFARKLATTQRQVEKTEQIFVRKTQELAALRLALQPIPAHEAVAAITEGDAGTPGKPIAAAAAAAAASGRLRMAENRLELALVRKNEVDSANKHLLARVDAARRDRTIFDSIYKKLERETSVSKARHDQARAELSRATQARDALAREVARLQDATEREQFEYEHQFQELKHSIEHWRHETGVRLAASELRSASLSGPFGVSELLGGLDANSEQGNSNRGGAGALSRVTALSSWKIGVDRALTTVPDSLVAKYDEAFATIRERTGLQDASALAGDLLSRDAANFQRFKRVEELSREEVALQTQLAALTAQIDAFKAREGIASRASQKQHCRRVEAALRETQQKCEKFDAEIEERDVVLGRIKASVHSVHNTLAHAASGGSTSGNATVLGQGITDTNVIEYLQAIEMYTTELLQSKAIGEASEASPLKARGIGAHSQIQAQTVNIDSGSPLPVGHGPPTLPSDPRQKLHVHVPSFGGVDGVIELPAQVPPATPGATSNISTPSAKRSGTGSSSLTKQQLQCRRLSSRDSQAQRHFAALAVALHIHSEDKRSGNEKKNADAVAGEEMGDEEEEERALTYEELRRFAEKNTKSKRRSAAKTQY